MSRYTHKTAIANNRLTAVDADRVTFQYRDYKDGSRVKSMTLEAMEFIRRFLQHVLPSGFQRIRHYGFLSNANRQTKLLQCLRLTRTAIRPKVKLSAQALMLKLTGNDLSTCPACGGQWQQVLTLAPNTG
ncbi:transposase [Paenibacillus sp. IB182496]|uniref:Transposase n=1 Tax=Paenibacillus sabuli TaxID=2772509 RepID=A0A927GPT4_9BACL|nr:transposase [Paenibacillus sabuli]